MKLQSLAVIFAIIMIPISIALSMYVQANIDTIVTQNSYDAKLYNSTYDAIKAFQLNTLNNNYSTVSDSKIVDIEASINSFFNSLANNLKTSGYDQNVLKTFIPAMVYTLYDGYYIYSPYKNNNPKSPDVILETGLKPYIYYTGRYVGKDYDLTINYTLDNYIAVYGTINGNYVTKSGYLINTSEVTGVKLDGDGNAVIQDGVTITYKGVKIEPEELQEYLLMSGETEGKYYSYIYQDKEKLYYDTDKQQYFRNRNNEKVWVSGISGKRKDTSAIAYVKEAYEFSMWANQNLKDITLNDLVLVKEDGQVDTNIMQNTNFNNIGNQNIFVVNQYNDPEERTSVFNEHRRAIIRYSIQSNLDVAIANYNTSSEAYGSTYDFRMPILKETDWDKILDNVCVIAFMQGIPMKTKMYNGYSIVSNDINKETINGDAFYFVDKSYDEEGNLVENYHKIECSELASLYTQPGHTIKAYTNVPFVRQTVSKSSPNAYYYGQYASADYNCVVTPKSTVAKEENLKDTNIKTEYWTALIRERYNLYKATEITDGGIDLNPTSGAEIIPSTTRPTKDEIKVTIKVPDDGQDYEIIIGDKDPQDIPPGEHEIIIDENTTIIVRPKQDQDDDTRQEISNIDKIPPTVEIDVDNKIPDTYPVTVNSTNTLTVIAKNGMDTGSGITGYRYSIDGGKTWTEISSETTHTWYDLKADTTYIVSVKAVDFAGNESIEASMTVKTLAITPNQITMVADVTTPRNTKKVTPQHGIETGKIKVTIKYGQKDGYYYEYSIGDTQNWQRAYSDQVVVEIDKNQPVFARYNDGGQNTQVWGPLTISNVDNEAPDATNINTNGYQAGTWTQGDITLSFDAQDRLSEGESQVNSGIMLYQYSIDGGRSWYDITSDTDWYIVEKKTSRGAVSQIRIIKDVNYELRIRAVDLAGNDGASSEMVSIKRNTQGPTLTKAEIKNVTASGYDVYLYEVKDPAGIEKIQFPTWTTANGQDDIQPDWENSIAASGKEIDGNGTWYYRVNVTDHNGEWGEYNTHVYLYDTLGKVTTLELKTQVPEAALIKITADVTTPRNTTEGSAINGVARGPIKITIQYGDTGSNNSNKYQYKVGLGDWQVSETKVKELLITENTTIYARYYDGTSESYLTTYTVANVDNVAPVDFELQYNPKRDAIEIKGWTFDKASPQAAIDTAGIKGYQYSIDGGTTWSAITPSTTYLAEGLDRNKVYSLKMKAIDYAGNETITKKEVKASPIEGIKIEIMPTTWTNRDVAVSIKYPEGTNFSKLWRTKDSNVWKEYIESGVSVSENTTVYAMLGEPTDEVETVTEIDSEGNPIQVEVRVYNTIIMETMNITNIDKVAPEAPIITNPTIIDPTKEPSEANTNWAHEDIPITLYAKDILDGVEGLSGIQTYQYRKVGDETWTDVTNKVTIPFPEEYNSEVYFRAIDKAGNVSPISKTWVKINKTRPSILYIENSSNEEWVNGAVTVKVQANRDVSGIKDIQYNIGGTSSWISMGTVTGNAATKIWDEHMNQRIYFKVINNAGNESIVNQDTSTLVRIDKKAPNNEAPSATSTTNTVTVTSRQTDSDSGINTTTIQYAIKKNGVWSSWQSSNNFIGLAHNTSYVVKTRAKDNVGNGYTESGETTIKTKQLTVGTLNLRYSDGTGYGGGWVNKNVYVTLNQGSGGTSTYASISGSAQGVGTTTNQTIISTTGVTKLRVTTTDGTNTLTKDYNIYVDKVAPNAYTASASSTETSITIRGSTSDNHSGISGYHYWISSSGWTGRTTATSHTFTGLSEGTAYTVRMTAYDNAGNEKWSNDITISTKDTKATIRNLVTNSGFENGTNGWTMSGDPREYTVVGNDIGWGSSKMVRTSYAIANSTAKQNIYLVAGHKYYIKASGKTTVDSRLSYQPYLQFAGIQFGVTGLSDGSGNPGPWSTQSNLVTAGTTGYQTLSVGQNLPHVGQITWVTNIVVIDLTADFGAGREPDINWCNNNIGWFEGTTRVNRP